MKVKTRKKNTPAPVSELRILVCGSRDWPNSKRDVIGKELARVINEHGVHPKDILVIEGEADGADTLVRMICEEDLGIACAGFRAPWAWADRQGNRRMAGPMRNGWMLRWGQPNYVLAFHPYLPNSRGTKNMVEQARAKGIPIRIVER